MWDEFKGKWLLKKLKEKVKVFIIFFNYLCKEKKNLSLDNGRKKKKKTKETPNPNLSFITPLTLLNPLFTKQQTSTPILILGTCFLVLLVHFFLHIKGMPIPFKFH